jgi:hypothetical protein
MLFLESIHEMKMEEETELARTIRLCEDLQKLTTYYFQPWVFGSVTAKTLGRPLLLPALKL